MAAVRLAGELLELAPAQRPDRLQAALLVVEATPSGLLEGSRQPGEQHHARRQTAEQRGGRQQHPVHWVAGRGQADHELHACVGERRSGQAQPGGNVQEDVVQIVDEIGLFGAAGHGGSR